MQQAHTHFYGYHAMCVHMYTRVRAHTHTQTEQVLNTGPHTTMTKYI